MRIYRVQSSQIVAVGWRSDLKVFRVYFGKVGAVAGVYEYPGVSAGLAGECIFSESVGSFFGKHIKPNFNFEKLEGEKLDKALEVLEAM